MQMQLASTQAGLEKSLQVNIQRTGRNGRIICASVLVPTPKRHVWTALTAYDSLDAYIPGLVQNKCLERFPRGCVLKQVAAQSLGPFKLNLGAKLRVEEHTDGVSPEFKTTRNEDYPTPFDWGNSSQPWDITFEMLQGDLRRFVGVWRVQSDGECACLLSYTAMVEAPAFVPVALIQRAIEREFLDNVLAMGRRAVVLAAIPSSADDI